MRNFTKAFNCTFYVACFLIGCCMLLSTNKAYCHYHVFASLTGVVTADSSGAPLAGVSVQIKGTGRGTTTDSTGRFNLEVSAGDILVFSYVGYDTKQVVINTQTEISVTMTSNRQQLEQVVVVGYGTQRRRDVTGSVATVKGEELARQPVQTPVQALQGKAAGVQIVSSGAPNSQPTVRIRGTGTMLAGAEPLYVVDGVLTNDIRNINNADIVSVDVLKDASSQAIYGLSGGNGVVIITTKQGRTGKLVTSYSGDVGVRQVAHKVQMADAAAYLNYQKDASPDLEVPANPANTDWYDAILKNGLQQNHNVSFSGGTEAVKYYFSASYFGDEGIVLDNSFKRYTVRSNNSFNIADNLKFNVQVSYTNGRTHDVNLGGAYNDAFRAAPVIPSKINGKYGNTSAFQNVGNPVLDLQAANNILTENRLQGSFGLEFKPVPSLTLRSVFNPDYNTANRRIYNYQFNADTSTFLTPSGNQRVDQSSLSLRLDNYFSYTWDNTATFQKRFNASDLTVLGGFLLNHVRSNYILGNVREVPVDPNLWYLSAGNPNTQTNENLASEFNRISYLARVNYAYDERYILTGSVRYDGTSRFGANNRWLASPAIGAAWVISRERFMENQNIFNYLKLRASWGRVGNENIDPNLFVVTATSNIPYFFNGQPILGTAIQDIKDVNLKWETMEESDLALEFAFLNNKLTGEATYYNKTTKNALVNVVIPGILGDPNSQYTTNAASFSNKGVELGLNWRGSAGADFTYSIGVNGTYNKNKILNLQQGQPLFGGSVGSQGFVTYSANGQTIGSFYVLQSLGVFHSQEEIDNYINKSGEPIQPGAQPGDLKYADLNGDGTIDVSATSADRTFAGSYQPKFYYGINLGANFKGFDLIADFYGNVGNKIYNGKRAFRYDPRDNVEASYVADRWTTTNPSGNQPRILSQSMPASTYFVESGNYLRLNNITLGYTIPAKSWARAGISAFRVYVTSQNLFTLTPYSGFTPADLPGSPLEAGIELNAYPTSRTYAFGINVTF